jgi:ubiquinone/menaquinone biosynthesis C-methylase UbiE
MDIYSPEYQRKFFDSFARTYHRVNFFSFGFVNRIRRRALCEANIPENATVCDLMCGDGNNIPYFRKTYHCSRIYAVDFSQVMLAKAKKKYSGKDVHFLNENSLELSLANESVDAVTCTFGIKTLNQADRKKLINEINRILKPGGVFVLVEVSKPDCKIPFAISFILFNFILELEAFVFNYKFIRRRFLWRFINGFGSAKEIGKYSTSLFSNVNFFSWYGGIVTGIEGKK